MSKPRTMAFVEGQILHISGNLVSVVSGGPVDLTFDDGSKLLAVPNGASFEIQDGYTSVQTTGSVSGVGVLELGHGRKFLPSSAGGNSQPATVQPLNQDIGFVASSGSVIATANVGCLRVTVVTADASMPLYFYDENGYALWAYSPNGSLTILPLISNGAVAGESFYIPVVGPKSVRLSDASGNWTVIIQTSTEVFKP